MGKRSRAQEGGTVTKRSATSTEEPEQQAVTIATFAARCSALAALYGVSVSASTRDPRVVTGAKLALGTMYGAPGTPALLRDALNSACFVMESWAEMLRGDRSQEALAAAMLELSEAEDTRKEYDRVMARITQCL